MQAQREKSVPQTNTPKWMICLVFLRLGSKGSVMQLVVRDTNQGPFLTKVINYV